MLPKLEKIVTLDQHNIKIDEACRNRKIKYQSSKIVILIMRHTRGSSLHCGSHSLSRYKLFVYRAEKTLNMLYQSTAVGILNSLCALCSRTFSYGTRVAINFFCMYRGLKKSQKKKESL